MALNDFKYIQIVKFLFRMKIVHGNDFLNVTLRNHPKIKNALLDYEKQHIIDLERELDSES